MPAGDVRSSHCIVNHLDRPGHIEIDVKIERRAGGVIFTANSGVPDNDGEAPNA
jgi:hypothetical protein